MPIANFYRRRYQPKRPPIANNRPGSPEFAQERDNRSKKAKFIFREIGSIRATRLSPQPPPRNRVSRGRSLLGGDLAALSRSSSRLRLWHVCRMNIPCRRSWPWLCGRQWRGPDDFSSNRRPRSI